MKNEQFEDKLQIYAAAFSNEDGAEDSSAEDAMELAAGSILGGTIATTFLKGRSYGPVLASKLANFIKLFSASTFTKASARATSILTSIGAGRFLGVGALAEGSAFRRSAAPAGGLLKGISKKLASKWSAARSQVGRATAWMKGKLGLGRNTLKLPRFASAGLRWAGWLGLAITAYDVVTWAYDKFSTADADSVESGDWGEDEMPAVETNELAESMVGSTDLEEVTLRDAPAEAAEFRDLINKFGREVLSATPNEVLTNEQTFAIGLMLVTHLQTLVDDDQTAHQLGWALIGAGANIAVGTPFTIVRDNSAVVLSAPAHSFQNSILMMLCDLASERGVINGSQREELEAMNADSAFNVLMRPDSVRAFNFLKANLLTQRNF